LRVLLHTAELATFEMARLPGLDEDLTFTDTAWDLREAQEELEWVHPELPRSAAAVDPGEAACGHRAGVGLQGVRGRRAAAQEKTVRATASVERCTCYRVKQRHEQLDFSNHA